MDFVSAIILGVVEGLTEFLPISSTGHLILVQRVLSIPLTEFWKSFDIAIQLGAILAVVALYWRKLIFDRAVYLRVGVAFLPTAVVGLVLYPIIKQFWLGNASLVVWALALGGLVLAVFEHWYQPPVQANQSLAELGWGKIWLVGLAQAIAVVPGVSRAAATILGGLTLGISRKTIVEFSFLLAVPTMLAATALDLARAGTEFSGIDYLTLAIGFATSFTVALLAVKWLIRFIEHHRFTVFGLYRLCVALVFWLVVI